MGAMEMLALGLKSVGAYLSRSLSYEGAEFQLRHLPLAPQLTAMYDRAAEFWQLLYRVYQEAARMGGMTLDANRCVLN